MATLNVDFLQMRRCIVEHLSSYGVPAEAVEHRFILDMVERARERIAREHPERALRYHREAMALIERIEFDAAGEAHLFPSTRSMLSELRSRKIKTGVVTRNCRAALERVFPDIYTAIDVVLTRNHIARVKPDPEHLRQALCRLGALPKKSAMVGDHPMDIQLALSVGTIAIGVLTGYTDRTQLEAAGADRILEKVSDIIGLLHSPLGIRL